MTVAGSDSRREMLVAVIAICVATLLVFLPALFGSPKLNESFWIDWVWLDQFSRELGAGHLYPRWLPLSHHGLGSPVFYYYPPVAFYVGAGFVLAGLSTYASIVAAFATASVLSGIGMYVWLRGWSRSPVFGSVVFVVAPYHAFDFYSRGALAEAMAIAAMPFVMLNLRRVLQGEGGILTAAIAYACLIGSHLPLALLASAFLIAPYVVWHCKKAPSRCVAAAAAIALGIALASIYLVPALALERYRDAAALWGRPMFRPSSWTFWDPSFLRGVFLVVLGIAVSLAIPCVRLAITRRSRWSMYALLCILLGIGAFPIIWETPLLSSVQFPFRILPLAEFGLATAISQIAWSTRKLIETVAPVLIATAFVIMVKAAPDPVTISQLRSLHPDVPENLPPGKRPYSWPSIWALQTAKEHARAEITDGITTEPVFYFPAWTVRCAGELVRTFPAPDTQLLSYHGENCARVLGYTRPEQIGRAITLLAVISFLVLGSARYVGRTRGRRLAHARSRRNGNEVC